MLKALKEKVQKQLLKKLQQNNSPLKEIGFEEVLDLRFG